MYACDYVRTYTDVQVYVRNYVRMHTLTWIYRMRNRMRIRTLIRMYVRNYVQIQTNWGIYHQTPTH